MTDEEEERKVKGRLLLRSKRKLIVVEKSHRKKQIRKRKVKNRKICRIMERQEGIKN